MNRVLYEDHARKVWDAEQIDWLARRMLFENAAEIYGINSGSLAESSVASGEETALP